MAGELLMRFEQPPDPRDLATVRAAWRQLHRDIDEAAVGHPFVVATPLGLAIEPAVSSALAAAGVEVVSRHAIDDWPRTSTFIYARTDDDERLTVALAFEQTWRSVSLLRRAEVWALGGAADLARAIALKPHLHQCLGTVQLRLELPGISLPTPRQQIRLRAVHVPDVDRVDVEWQLLRANGHRIDVVS